MSKVSTNITLDNDLKQKAKSLYSSLGMDLTTAITIFLTQSIRERGMPFKPTLCVSEPETVIGKNNSQSEQNNGSVR